MHELSLTKPILSLALEHAAKHNASNIRKITLAIGSLSCASPQSIRWCFQQLSKSTLAEHAELIIEEETAQAQCLTCGEHFETHSLLETCPHCESNKVQHQGGERFVLKSISIDS